MTRQQHLSLKIKEIIIDKENKKRKENILKYRWVVPYSYKALILSVSLLKLKYNKKNKYILNDTLLRYCQNVYKGMWKWETFLTHHFCIYYTLHISKNISPT